MGKINNEEKYPCSYCGLKFRNKISMENHEKECSKISPRVTERGKKR